MLHANKIWVVAIILSLFTSASAVAKDDWAMAEKIVKAIELPQIPEQSFTITDFGAVVGEKNDALPAITAAMDAASKKGGGRIVIPEGVWLVKGPIHLVSKIDLHLSEGARLLFSSEPSDYLPVVKTRWEGTELMHYSPLVYAANVTDVAITGTGTLDGNANSCF